MTEEPTRARRLRLTDVEEWLRQGWSMFRASAPVSMAYASIFFILGLLLQAVIAGGGYGLIYFLFATGFPILAPLLSVVFYHFAALIERGEKPGWGAIIAAIRHVPAAAWAVGMALVALYLIWITDALIIYSVYFRFDPISFHEYFTNDRVSSDASSFVSYAGALGLVLTFVAFSIGVFSIPHAFSTRAGLVAAVVFSVSNVFRNFVVMMVWAAVLATVLTVTLLVAMPLGIVAFPVLSMANAAAYRQLREMHELPPAG